VLVAERRAFIEHPTINAPAQVFDELAEDAPIDAPQPSIGIDLDARHHG
jgi:hypothetical protein